MNTIKRLVITFENSISQSEVPLFRGAVNAALADNHSILFHNHNGTSLRYSYPLIQYKRIGTKAAIVCVNEGTTAMQQFFDAEPQTVRIGTHSVALAVESVVADKPIFDFADDFCEYTIHHWLPLNSENYKLYQSTDILAERVALLERILTGNILSALKGLGIIVDKQIVCRILDISSQDIHTYKGVRLLAFTVRFKTNFHIPEYLGIGKDASVGYGVIKNI